MNSQKKLIDASIDGFYALPDQTSHPLNAKEGDVYYNTNDDYRYYYDGSNWIPFPCPLDILAQQTARQRLEEHKTGAFIYTKEQLRKIILDAYPDNFEKIKKLKEFKCE